MSEFLHRRVNPPEPKADIPDEPTTLPARPDIVVCVDEKLRLFSKREGLVTVDELHDALLDVRLLARHPGLG